MQAFVPAPIVDRRVRGSQSGTGKRLGSQLPGQLADAGGDRAVPEKLARNSGGDRGIGEKLREEAAPGRFGMHKRFGEEQQGR